MRKFKNVLIGLIMCAAAMTGTIAVTAAPVQAKTVQAVTSNKKSKAVKSGTTTVKFNLKQKKHAYVKFTAPKTGKYSFTVSNYKTNTKGLDINNGYFSVVEYFTKWGSHEVSASTKGGKTYAFYFCTSASWKIAGTSKITKYTYAPSRTASGISLKKGQTVYLDFYSTSKNYSLQLKIK